MTKCIDLSPLFPVNRVPMDIFDFTGQVDRIYKGSGIPTLYGVLSILANKSVFYIGGRGIGKTRIVDLIPNVEGTEVSKWDTFTLEELSNYCSEISGCGYVEGKHLVFKVQEFSTLSDYHREIFLTVCSKIVSDGNYKHVTTRTPFLDIRGCKLTLLIAIQPKLYSLLCNRYTQWESMSYDRFSKFIILNPLRSETIDAPLIPTLPRKITKHVIFEGDKLDLEKVVSMYKGHVSEGRAYLYARDYATALAKFTGSDRVTGEHVDTFYQLFHPYLDSFSVLQEAKDLDSAIEVSSGKMKLLTEIAKYNGVVSKKKLADDLHVSERHIERCAKILIEAELISKPKKAHYGLSDRLKKYFQEYESRI